MGDNVTWKYQLEPQQPIKLEWPKCPTCGEPLPWGMHYITTFTSHGDYLATFTLTATDKCPKANAEQESR